MHIVAQFTRRFEDSFTQGRTKGLCHVYVHDAVNTAVKKRTVPGMTRKIDKLIRQDKIVRLVVRIDSAYSRRRKDGRNTQFLQAQDISPVIDEMGRNGMVFPMSCQKDDVFSLIRSAREADRTIEVFHLSTRHMGQHFGVTKACTTDNGNIPHGSSLLLLFLFLKKFHQLIVADDILTVTVMAGHFNLRIVEELCLICFL